MLTTEPMTVVMEFIRRINSGDVDRLCEIMADDHVFQDALGKRFVGKETLRQGWKTFFAGTRDYKVHGVNFFEAGELVAVFGTASGTSIRDGKFSKEGFWEVPAAWKAEIRGGLVAAWSVYAESSRP